MTENDVGPQHCRRFRFDAKTIIVEPWAEGAYVCGKPFAAGSRISRCDAIVIVSLPPKTLRITHRKKS